MDFKNKLKYWAENQKLFAPKEKFFTKRDPRKLFIKRDM